MIAIDKSKFNSTTVSMYNYIHTYAKVKTLNWIQHHIIVWAVSNVKIMVFNFLNCHTNNAKQFSWMQQSKDIYLNTCRVLNLYNTYLDNNLRAQQQKEEQSDKWFDSLFTALSLVIDSMSKHFVTLNPHSCTDTLHVYCMHEYVNTKTI